MNITYWSGYRDGQHPAVYTLRLGRQIGNGCELSLPPSRINEPFATSPFRSTVALAVAHQPKGHITETVAVHLVDDARPAHGMRNRRVIVEDGAGNGLAIAVTDVSGVARVRLGRAVTPLEVVDVTDNNLRVTAHS